MQHRDARPTPKAVKLLSVVIPARNEEGSLPDALCALHALLSEHRVPHEIVVVDDGSRDSTWTVLEGLRDRVPTLRPLRNTGRNGFGRAIVSGLDASRGDAVVVMMADLSDSPDDVLQYWHRLNEGWDCVFGTRFSRGGRTYGYPVLKLLLNRIANRLIALVFNIRLDDTTNAFKAYRRTVIDGVRPILAPHFNLTVELPLKAIVRGYSWTVVPITWRKRKAGASSFRIREMGSRYFFICAYVWLEKYFSRGDYVKEAAPQGSSPERGNTPPATGSRQ